MRLLIAAFAVCFAADVSEARAAFQTGGGVVAVVNGAPITNAEFERFLRTKRVGKTVDPKIRDAMLNQLIDTRLIAAELARLKVKADPESLDRTLQAFLSAIRKSGNDPQKILQKIGHTKETFKAELALTLAWKRYASERGVITAAEIKSVFQNERSRYDGTRLRARQIVLKLPPNANQQAKDALIGRLNAIRREIAAGKTDFADAAKLHSQSPSSEKGGDVGFFAYRGRLPTQLSSVAFALKNKEISDPFVTPFGVHILQVTERKPGQLSLEDARPEILKRLAEERWKSMAKQLRSKAKIERKQ